MGKKNQKIGKLTILDIQKSACDLVHICQCECGQMVFLSHSQVQRQSKTSCENCLDPDYIFSPNEIAVMEFSLSSQIPKSEQVIVIQQKGINVTVEYKGKYFQSRSENFKSLGIKF